MLDYARQRASAALGSPRTAILITSGPAGVQTSEFRCEVIELSLYLLIPQTSDHLFNLEHESTVTVLTATCELKGRAQPISCAALELKVGLCHEPDAERYVDAGTAAMLRMMLLTSTRPSASALGEIVSPAARIATNAEPQSITVTSPASRATMSVRGAAEARELSTAAIFTSPHSAWSPL